MNTRSDQQRATVRCYVCPGHPILPTHWEEAKTDRCVRCQGEHRILPLPHPEDHLCKVCRRECPNCHALTTEGGRCRACRGTCRTCSGPLPDRPDPAGQLVHVEPERRKDRRRRDFRRTYYPRSWGWDQCEACRAEAAGTDPVGKVLAALPGKVIEACGGAVPPAAVQTIHTELHQRTPLQLAARIERRWWRTWSHQRLERPADDHHEGWRPDDIAVWLLAPTACPDRCEDGWHLAPPERPDQDDTPCTSCKGGRMLRHDRFDDEPDEWSAREAKAPTAADRSLTEAITYRPPTRECVGQDGACGVPVAEPYRFCPGCADWPWCTCGHRRYNPNQATACGVCTAIRNTA